MLFQSTGNGEKLLRHLLDQRRVHLAHRWGEGVLLEAEEKRSGRPHPVPFVLGYAQEPSGSWALDHAHASASDVQVLDGCEYLYLAAAAPSAQKPYGASGRSLWRHRCQAPSDSPRPSGPKSPAAPEQVLATARGVVAFSAGGTNAVAAVWSDPRSSSLAEDAARHEAWRDSGEFLTLPGRDLWPQLGHRPDHSELRLVRVPLSGEGVPELLDVTLEENVKLTGQVSVTPDGKRCAAGLVRFHADGNRRFGMYVFSVERPGAGRALWADVDLSAPVSSPDSIWFACAGETVATPRSAPHRGAVLVSSLGERVIDNTTAHDDWLEPHAWDGSDTLLCVGEVDGRRRVRRVGLDGTVDTPLEIAGSVRSVTVWGDEALVVRSGVDLPPEVAPFDLRAEVAGEDPNRLFSPAEDARPVGRTERVAFRVQDGTTWHGWLCLPQTKDGMPLPTLVWCHGGPMLSWTDWSWRWNPWPYVAEGYAVLMIDPPLSLGYGRPAVARGWGRWRTEVARIAAEQVRGVLREDPRLDATRVAVMGASFGGWLALALGALLANVRLVVSHAGWVDLASVARTCDLHWHWLREYGPPESSLAYARETVRLSDFGPGTRVLLSHGHDDAHVPVFEALGVHRSLQARGVEVEVMFLPDEGHTIRRHANTLTWFSWVREACKAHLLPTQSTLPTPERDGGDHDT